MRLNLGCGRDVADGWVNADVAHYDTWPPTPDELTEELRPGVYLIEEGALPFGDDTFDGAVAHHVLQMLAWPELVPWLREVRRVLKPGAVLRVTVPHMVAAFYAWESRRDDWFPVDAESCDEKLCVYLSQNGATRSLFTVRSLALLLGRAGFSSVTVVARNTTGPEWLTELDTRLGESIVLEGQA